MRTVIIEAPGKIKTMRNALSGWRILATKGRIYDLPLKDIGVYKTKDGFKGRMLPLKPFILDMIKKNANRSAFVATDPDREGEAAAKDVYDLLSIPYNRRQRIRFNSLDIYTLTHAIRHPGRLDVNIATAQYLKRLLDRLIGWKLSKKIFNDIKLKTGTGRVQAVVLSWLATLPEKRWKVFIPLTIGMSGSRGIALIVNHPPTSTAKVLSVSSKRQYLAPPKPHITASMIMKSPFSPSKTMSIAQSLYEKAYITYIRTKNADISPYGECVYHRMLGHPALTLDPYVNEDLAHECIRPAQPFDMSMLEATRDEKRLYSEIARRFVASMSNDALVDTLYVELDIGQKHKIEIDKVLQPGWMSSYGPSERLVMPSLPALSQGNRLRVFYEPQPRITEREIVNWMAENNVGYPSNWHITINNLKRKKLLRQIDYEGIELSPEAEQLIEWIEKNASWLNLDYTHKIENVLEAVERGEAQPDDFWKIAFDPAIKKEIAPDELMPDVELMVQQ